MKGRLTAGQWLLRALVAAMPVLAVLCTIGAGGAAPVWFVVLVAVLGLGWAAYPESAAGVAVLVLVLAWWGIGLRDGLDPWAVPATAAILTAHLAAVVSAYGPAQLPVDPPVARLWVRRGLAVFVPAPLLLLVATWLRGSPEPDGIWVLGLAGAFLAIVAASATFSRGRAAA